MAVIILQAGVALLFAVMAVRAFQSATLVDRALAVLLVVGVILLFAAPKTVAVYWLLACAAAYLVSQISTGARPVSRALPLLGAVLTAALGWLSGP
jgi:hypothetical protein